MRVHSAAILLFGGLTACDLIDRGRGSPAQRPEGSAEAYSSPGDVSLREADGGGAVTSEQYRQWYAAHQGLDRRIASRFGALLQPSAPTERSIDRAVAYLNSEPAARDAIRRSGMTVRDFVHTTIALEQEMRVASQAGLRPADTLRVGSVYPYPYPYPTDTTAVAPPYPTTPPNPYPLPQPATPYPMTPPTTATPAPALPQPRDTARRVDTVFVQPPVRRDTSTAKKTIFWSRDTSLFRRDTTPKPVRDTLRVRRDTTPKPLVPRDTIPVDTLKSSQH